MSDLALPWYSADVSRASGNATCTDAVVPHNVERIVSDLLKKLESDFPINPQLLTFDNPSLYYTSQGSCGDVKKASLILSEIPSLASIPVAVKVLRIADNTNIADVKRKFVREVLVLSKLKHPNVVELVGVHFSSKEPSAWIVCPWMSKGDSARFVLKYQPGAIEILNLLKDATSALSYLHSQNPPLRHGDVKAANLLVTDDNRGKLSDFGLASLLDDPAFKVLRSEMKGSWRWSSPEALMGHCGIEADVYALAWVVYELFTGRHPYPEILNEAMVIQQVVSGSNGGHPALLESDVPFPPLREMMRKCWERDVSARASVVECMSSISSLLFKASSDPHLNPNFTALGGADSGYGTSVCDTTLASETSESEIPEPGPLNSDGDPANWRAYCKSICYWLGSICCCCGPRRRKPKDGGRFGGGGDDDDDDDDDDGHTYPQLEVDNDSLTRGTANAMIRNRRPQAIRARLVHNVSYFALKPLYDRVEAAGSTKVQAIVAQQVMSMKEINSPRILSPLGLTTVDGVLHLVTPWQERGNLRQLLLDSGVADSRRMIVVLKAVAEALLVLHEHGRVHSGLKLENVLIDQDGSPVLAEAGLSKLVEDLRLGSYGCADDVRRIAPEVLAGGPFTPASDVYAFGCLAHEVIIGKRPFDGCEHPGEVIMALNRGEYPAEQLSDSPLGDSLRPLFLRCWDPNPDKRPGISDVSRTLACLSKERQNLSCFRSNPSHSSLSGPSIGGQELEHDNEVEGPILPRALEPYGVVPGAWVRDGAPLSAIDLDEDKVCTDSSESSVTASPGCISRTAATTGLQPLRNPRESSSVAHPLDSSVWDNSESGGAVPLDLTTPVQVSLTEPTLGPNVESACTLEPVALLAEDVRNSGRLTLRVDTDGSPTVHIEEDEDTSCSLQDAWNHLSPQGSPEPFGYEAARCSQILLDTSADLTTDGPQQPPIIKASLLATTPPWSNSQPSSNPAATAPGPLRQARTPVNTKPTPSSRALTQELGFVHSNAEGLLEPQGDRASLGVINGDILECKASANTSTPVSLSDTPSNALTRANLGALPPSPTSLPDTAASSSPSEVTHVVPRYKSVHTEMLNNRGTATPSTSALTDLPLSHAYPIRYSVLSAHRTFARDQHQATTSQPKASLSHGKGHPPPLSDSTSGFCTSISPDGTGKDSTPWGSRNRHHEPTDPKDTSLSRSSNFLPSAHAGSTQPERAAQVRQELNRSAFSPVPSWRDIFLSRVRVTGPLSAPLVTATIDAQIQYAPSSLPLRQTRSADAMNWTQPADRMWTPVNGSRSNISPRPLSVAKNRRPDDRARIVVAREKTEEIAVTAKEAEIQMRSQQQNLKEDGLDSTPSTPEFAMPKIFPAKPVLEEAEPRIDPTDVVDLPPYSSRSMKYGISGMDLEAGAGTGALADQLRSMRKALLHRAVSMTTPARSPSSPPPATLEASVILKSRPSVFTSVSSSRCAVADAPRLPLGLPPKGLVSTMPTSPIVSKPLAYSRAQGGERAGVSDDESRSGTSCFGRIQFPPKGSAEPTTGLEARSSRIEPPSRQRASLVPISATLVTIPNAVPDDSVEEYGGHDSSCGPSFGPDRKRGLGQSTFVSKLWAMVEDPSTDALIHWSADGQGFCVTNHFTFAQEQLPKVFKHNNFQSFVRQLNMYGFHKQNRVPRANRSDPEGTFWHFVHPNFLRYRLDLAREIKRRPGVMRPPRSTIHATPPSDPTPPEIATRYEQTYPALSKGPRQLNNTEEHLKGTVTITSRYVAPQGYLGDRSLDYASARLRAQSDDTPSPNIVGDQRNRSFHGMAKASGVMSQSKHEDVGEDDALPGGAVVYMPPLSDNYLVDVARVLKAGGADIFIGSQLWLDASTEHRQLNESRVYDANRKANEKSVSWSKDSAKCDFRPNEGPLTPSVLAKEFPIYSRSETICGDLRWATQTGAQIRDCIVPEATIYRLQNFTEKGYLEAGEFKKEDYSPNENDLPGYQADDHLPNHRNPAPDHQPASTERRLVSTTQ